VLSLGHSREALPFGCRLGLIRTVPPSEPNQKRGRPGGRPKKKRPPRRAAQVREETPKEGCNTERHARCCTAQFNCAPHIMQRASGRRQALLITGPCGPRPWRRVKRHHENCCPPFMGAAARCALVPGGQRCSGSALVFPLASCRSIRARTRLRRTSAPSSLVAVTTRPPAAMSGLGPHTVATHLSVQCNLMRCPLYVTSCMEPPAASHRISRC